MLHTFCMTSFHFSTQRHQFDDVLRVLIEDADFTIE